MKLTASPKPRPKVIVVSHERSGTHFLMNSLALSLGYVADPRVDLDRKLGLDFHTPLALQHFFAQFRGTALLNLFKSHHQAGFFAPLLSKLRGEYVLCYVHRDPADTLSSMRGYLHRFRGDEGPRCPDLSSLLHAEPAGALMRYQKRQHPTMVHRWREHVIGWRALAEVAPDVVVPVAYEDLSEHFEHTLEDLAGRLGLPMPSTVVRPDLTTNVINPGKGLVGAGWDQLGDTDRDWLVELTESVRPPRRMLAPSR